MYPPIKCPVCSRGDLNVIYNLMLEYRSKHQPEILKDNRFKAYGETLNFPLVNLFDEFKLMQCCRIEVMTKDDMIASIYGLPGMDKK